MARLPFASYVFGGAGLSGAAPRSLMGRFFQSPFANAPDDV
jgi:hypothetical protein